MLEIKPRLTFVCGLVQHRLYFRQNNRHKIEIAHSSVVTIKMIWRLSSNTEFVSAPFDSDDESHAFSDPADPADVPEELEDGDELPTAFNVEDFDYEMSLPAPDGEEELGAVADIAAANQDCIESLYDEGVVNPEGSDSPAKVGRNGAANNA